jgi:hypothetical protein
MDSASATPPTEELRIYGIHLADDAVIESVIAERRKQIAKGYTPEHDDKHAEGDLAIAADRLLLAAEGDLDVARELWPWTDWMPARLNQDGPMTHEDRRDLLVTAAALLIAEIARQDRAVANQGAAA